MNSIKYFYIAIAILFSSENSFSKDVIINQNNTDNIDVSDCISFTIDSLSVLSYDQLEHLDVKWQTIEDIMLNKPINDCIYWYKIQIDNELDGHFLFFDDPLIELIDVYFISDSILIEKSSSGSSLNSNQREVPINNYCFKLPKGSYTCYFRLEKKSNYHLPLKILSLDNIILNEKNNNLFLGFYFGILLLFLIYNMILSFFLS
jgi:two-component system, sensor histidine kinase LadS